MNIAPRQSKPIHLTYCLNVHPGETWPAQLDAIRTHARAVRTRVCADAPFGLGLRLSAQAADELSAPGALETFQTFLQENNLYVFTVNGFPYGRFHGGHVKERVYLPDWTDAARRDYTNGLATLLARLLPEQMPGSISTVPGAYRVLVRGAAIQERMARHLMDTVAHLVSLERETGREIHIGLEPEPACFLETSDDFLRYFNDVLLFHGGDYLARISGVSLDTAEAWIHRHVGVCLDICHAALQFEEPATCIRRYNEAGIRLSKIQLSSALEITNDEQARTALRAFDEPVYLHQTHARLPDGQVLRWTDLPDALAALPRQPLADLVRVHFHVPLFWAGLTPLRTTASVLDRACWDRLREGACPHLEIETYTFDVLPESIRLKSVDESIVSEFNWVMEQWHENE